jgi:hypothetical protein
VALGGGLVLCRWLIEGWRRQDRQKEAALIQRAEALDVRDAALTEQNKELAAGAERAKKEVRRAVRYSRKVRRIIDDGACLTAIIMPVESGIADGRLSVRVQAINRLEGNSLRLRGVSIFVTIDGCRIGEIPFDLPQGFRHVGFRNLHNFDASLALPADLWTQIENKALVLLVGTVYGYAEPPSKIEDEPSRCFGAINCWLPVRRTTEEEPNVRP